MNLFGEPPTLEGAKGFAFGENQPERMAARRLDSLTRRVIDLVSPRYRTNDLFAAAQYEYRHGTFFVNPEAGEILRRVMSAVAGQNGPPAKGFHLNEAMNAAVQSLLKRQARNPALTNVAEALALAKTLKRATGI